MSKENKSPNAKQSPAEGAQKAAEASESKALDKEKAEAKAVAKQPSKAEAIEVPAGKFRKFSKGEKA